VTHIPALVHIAEQLGCVRPEDTGHGSPDMKTLVNPHSSSGSQVLEWRVTKANMPTSSHYIGDSQVVQQARILVVDLKNKLLINKDPDGTVNDDYEHAACQNVYILHTSQAAPH
jgi:hypothetical protein